jgi:hypothetical protein
MVWSSIRRTGRSLALASAGLAACGTSSGEGASGTSAVTGTVGGATIATTDTTALVGPLTVTSGTTTGTAYEAVVLITNQPDTCGIAESKKNPANTAILTLVVGNASPVVAGQYPIGTLAGTAAQAVYVAQDGQCATTTNDMAASGSITLTTVDASRVAGSFDLTFSTGDKLSGTFDTPVCGASISNLEQSNSQPCSG